MGSTPDYSSRDLRLRLFVALAAAMGLAALAERGCSGRLWQVSASPSSDKTKQTIAPRAVLPEPRDLNSTWDSVEDDTLFLRPAERDCWREIEERLRSAEPAELARQSIGLVGHTQLFHDPDDYRGQVVTVRGTVRFASHDQYYALWIRPEGGPTSPIVVYALELPPGFPRIESHSAGELTKLQEEVEVTGIFLKRGSYMAQNGPRTAPLMVARSPVWTRSQLDAVSGKIDRRAWLWPTVGASLVISGLIVLVVVRRTR